MLVRRFFYASFFVMIVLTTAAHAQPRIGGSDPLLAKNPDLVALSLDINNSGDLVAVLINRGLAVTTPFVAELHVDGHTRRTLSFVAGGQVTRTPVRTDASLNLALPLQQNEQRTLVIKNLDVGICTGSHTLRLVVDPAGAIGEAYENNNERSRSLAAPCPDLAVASIRKNYNSTRTQYVAEVVVVNQGTGTTPHFSIASDAKAGSQVRGGGATQYPPLAPGQTIKFTLGVAQSFESLKVEVLCDAGNVVTESNKDNNRSLVMLNP